MYQCNEEIELNFPVLKKGNDYEDLDEASNLKELLQDLLQEHSADFFSFRVFTLKVG